MQPETYYHDQIMSLSSRLKESLYARNGITFVKIMLFFMAIFLIYIFSVDQSMIFLFAFLGAIGLFIGINMKESKLLKKINFIIERKKCSEIELEYLAGNLTRLATGDEYKDQTHPYAHDLDLFGAHSLFQAINRTVTPHGKEKIRQWLLHPLKSSDEITERQQAVQELSENPDWNHAFRATGNCEPVSSLDLRQIETWQQEQFVLPRWITPFTYIFPVITVTSWVLCSFSIISSSLPLLLSSVSFLCSYLPGKRMFRAHSQLDVITRSFSNLHGLIEHFSRESYETKKLKRLHLQLFDQTTNANNALRALRKIQEGFDQRTNLLVAILMNSLFMRELHLLRQLINWKKEYAASIPGWIEATGELDALVSMANYKYNHPDFTTPVPNDNTILRATSIGHPLLPNHACITNDFELEHLHEFYIITGANMAGKSTFLRAIGVNLVLATCGSVVRAETFEFRPTGIFSSMRTVDNLAKGTSYFHAELLRLRQLVEMAGREERLFIILDEILKGTNSRDKLNGSRRFLQKLLTLPISGLVATHDLELGRLADVNPSNYFNRCFEITHTDDDIAYDYKLKPGISQNMNASILLEKMGLV